MKKQGVRIVNSSKYRAPLGTKEEDKAEMMINELLSELNSKGCDAVNISCTSFANSNHVIATILYEFEDTEES